jgi:hypothetical protein
MLKFSTAHTTMAIRAETMSSIQPGRPGMASRACTMMVQLVSAPTMSTSPWAKLMRPMMPYTMV